MYRIQDTEYIMYFGNAGVHSEPLHTGSWMLGYMHILLSVDLYVNMLVIQASFILDFLPYEDVLKYISSEYQFSNDKFSPYIGICHDSDTIYIKAGIEVPYEDSSDIRSLSGALVTTLRMIAAVCNRYRNEGRE